MYTPVYQYPNDGARCLKGQGRLQVAVLFKLWGFLLIVLARLCWLAGCKDLALQHDLVSFPQKTSSKSSNVHKNAKILCFPQKKTPQIFTKKYYPKIKKSSNIHKNAKILCFPQETLQEKSLQIYIKMERYCNFIIFIFVWNVCPGIPMPQWWCWEPEGTVGWVLQATVLPGFTGWPVGKFGHGESSGKISVGIW